MSWEVLTMQSKTSSSDPVKMPLLSGTLFRKNISRFWPLWAAYALIWALALPLNLFTLLHSGHSYHYEPAYSDLAWDILKSASSFSILMTLVFGCLMAMALYSYLCTARSVGFVHTLPIRRAGLFWTNYLSGLFMFFSAHVLVFVLTCLVLFTGSAGMPLRELVIWLGVSCCLSVLFFSFGVLCAMFTGQVLAIPVFFGVGNVLAIGIDYLVRTFSSIFLYGYQSGGSGGFTQWALRLSPVVYLSRNLHVESVWDESYSSILSVRILGLDAVWIYAAVGAAFALAALVVYCRRSSETAGDTVAVGWAKPVFKYGVACCSALGLGQGLYYLTWGQYQLQSDYSLTGVLVCIILMGLLGYFVAEMLMKKSFRVLRTSWKGAAVLTAVLLAFSVCMSMDLPGLEAKVPAAEDIDSISYSISSSYQYIDAETEDPALIALLREVHSRAVAEKDLQMDRSREYDRWARSSDMEPPAYSSIRLYLTYRLVSGSELSRRYTLYYEQEELTDSKSAVGALREFCAEPQAQIEYMLNGGDLAKVSGGEFEYFTFSERGSSSNNWYSLTTDEAKEVANAILEDIQSGRAGQNLFDEDSQMTNSLELYCLTDQHNRTDYVRIELNAGMRSTLQALEELDIAGEDRPLMTQKERQEKENAFYNETLADYNETLAEEEGIIGGADGPTEILVAEAA